MAAKKAEGKGDDWFDSLDAELEKKTKEVVDEVGEENVERAEINRQLIDDFWKIWKRFNKINVHLTMEPPYNLWAQFVDTFPDGDWTWRRGFSLASVNALSLIDRTMDQGRIGDGLKVTYYNVDEKPHLKVTYEYCEGEHYYKYSGWKRIWSIHTMYDESLVKVAARDLHRLFADIVKVWYESHLRRNRDILIKHLKKNYERVETFNQ